MDSKVQVNIRCAEKRDLPRLVELMKALTITTSQAESEGASSMAEFEKVFEHIESDPKHHLLVVEVDGKVIGSGDVLVVPNLSHRGLPWAVIENVIVEENMRCQGIARKLIAYMIDLAKGSGCYKIGLSSDKRRSAAHRLYESLGFRQYGLGYRIYF